MYGELTDIPAGNDFIAISAGVWHDLALRSNGTIVGWGDNSFDQTTPPPGDDYVSIEAGGGYSLALEAQ